MTGVCTFALFLGALVSSNVFAAQARWDAALGPWYVQLGILRVYAPWEIGRWAWRWMPQAGVGKFQLALLAGAGCTALVIGKAGQQCPRHKKGEAHWSKAKALKTVDGYGGPGTGLVLGKERGRVVRADWTLHAFGVGNTGSGKTSCAIPTLLECPHSVFCYDPKDGIRPKTQGRRRQLGRVVFLAPLDPQTDGYDPLSAVRPGTDDEYTDVGRITSFLTNPDGNKKRDSTTEHFEQTVNAFFNGALLYGLLSGMATTCAQFKDLITRTEWKDLITVMKHSTHDVVAQAGDVAGELVDRELGSVRSTAAKALSIFNDPRVARFTSRANFGLQELREQSEPCTVYYSVPFGDAERLRPLSRLLIRQMIGHTTTQLTGWKQRLLLCVDELPSLDKLNILSEALNFVREYGIQLFLLSPSLEELINIYGTHHNFLEESTIQLVYGLSDASVAERFSKRVGMHEVRTERMTRQAGGRRSSTEDVRQEPLLSTTALLQLARTDVLALVGQHSFILQQARYYQHKTWRQWSALP